MYNLNGCRSFPPNEWLSQHPGGAWLDIVIVGVDERVFEDDLIIQKSQGSHAVVVSGDIVHVGPQKFVVLGLHVVGEVDVGEGRRIRSEGCHVCLISVGVEDSIHVGNAIGWCVGSGDGILVGRDGGDLEERIFLLIVVEVVVVITEDEQRDVEGSCPWMFLINWGLSLLNIGFGGFH